MNRAPHQRTKAFHYQTPHAAGAVGKMSRNHRTQGPPPREPAQEVMRMAGPSSHHQLPLLHLGSFEFGYKGMPAMQSLRERSEKEKVKLERVSSTMIRTHSQILKSNVHFCFA
ncbi:hypothetical protein MtrunA17_Chr7g0266541 [Medicago truncatula]|nr:hypothetical protein MtrunA17_Chr7g0266541 [Medicago truncatula]